MMTNNLRTGIIEGFKILGIYQIIGGIIGLGFLFLSLSQLSGLSILPVLISLISFVLFSYSILCGILLLKKKPLGLRHSMINQFLQLIFFTFLGYSFHYIAGVFFTLGIDLTDSFLLTFNIGLSSWQMEISSGSPAINLNFNLVAFMLIIFIINLKAKVEDQWLRDKIAEIGN